MERWSFRHHVFVDRFLRSRGFWARPIETAGGLFLVVGSGMAITELWDDPERLAVPLLLAAICTYTFLCFAYLAGISVELSYLRERLLKETADIDA